MLGSVLSAARGILTGIVGIIKGLKMIEATILEYLSGALDVPCYMERPPGALGTFAVMEKTGESRENYINTAILAVQSYAPTLLHAAELNEQVKTAMFRAAQLPGVAAVHLNSDYNFTDTSSKTYRYQAVFDVTYYD